MKQKTCPNCQREFTPNWNTRKYCCDECADEYKRKRRAAIHAEVIAVSAAPTAGGHSGAGSHG